MITEPILPAAAREEFVSELFHENTKQRRSDARFIERIVAAAFDPTVQSVMGPSHKLYRNAKVFALPTRLPKAKQTFDDAVLSRRSSREFGKDPLPLNVAAKLLHCSYGITGELDLGHGHRQALRAAPSGGALYPIEIYLFARNVEKLPKGIYHFNSGERSLEQITAKDPFPELIKATYADELRNAALVMAITGVSLKNRVKYGERGYRFMLFEAGHIVQNFLLAANAMRLNAFAVGGFVDDELDAMLRVDGFEETSLYLAAAGRPPRSR
jgi:SagB-type dehydrogenase family enzyme